MEICWCGNTDPLPQVWNKSSGSLLWFMYICVRYLFSAPFYVNLASETSPQAFKKYFKTLNTPGNFWRLQTLPLMIWMCSFCSSKTVKVTPEYLEKCLKTPDTECGDSSVLIKCIHFFTPYCGPNNISLFSVQFTTIIPFSLMYHSANLKSTSGTQEWVPQRLWKGTPTESITESGQVFVFMLCFEQYAYHFRHNVWPFMSSIWFKRVYVNPSSNASDIHKVMEHQGFVGKSTFDEW